MARSNCRLRLIYPLSIKLDSARNFKRSSTVHMESDASSFIACRKRQICSRNQNCWRTLRVLKLLNSLKTPLTLIFSHRTYFSQCRLMWAQENSTEEIVQFSILTYLAPKDYNVSKRWLLIKDLIIIWVINLESVILAQQTNQLFPLRINSTILKLLHTICKISILQSRLMNLLISR